MGFLSSLFGGGSESQKPSNRLTKIETVATNGPNGATHGILVSVDAPDAATFSALMPTIIATFKNQRMVSPPDTSFLLITVVGSVSAAEFKRLWDHCTANDQIVGAFLSQMIKADVLNGTAEGKPLNSASLRK
jgi:hypothetical protein